MSAAHLRLASIDCISVKGRRPPRGTASPSAMRISTGRAVAASLAVSCERIEHVVQALYVAAQKGDVIVVQALATLAGDIAKMLGANGVDG